MMLKEIHHYPFRPSIPTLTLLLFFAIQGYSGLVFSAEYRVGGVNPEALLCRPEEKGPFPAVVHNHGVGVDIQGFQKAVRRGYNLPAICKELSEARFLTFISIRQGGRGLSTLLSHKAQVLQAVVEQKGLKALVIMAPAEIGRYFSTTLSQVSSLDAPVLLLVEASDESAIQNNFDTLDRILREHKKEAKSIRYDRGGGHNLFHSAGYYLQDVKAFLNEKLGGQ